MADPGWLQKLCAMHGRAAHAEMLRTAWLTYLVLRLPKSERAKVVRAMRAGKVPRDYEEAKAKK